MSHVTGIKANAQVKAKVTLFCMWGRRFPNDFGAIFKSIAGTSLWGSALGASRTLRILR